MMKKTISLILAMVLLLGVAFGVSQKASADDNVILLYEAFFLDNDEVMQCFSEARGPEAPYPIMTKDFHVTTAFMPELDKRELYGTEVTIKVYAYQNGEIKTDDGSMTANEGMFCTITADNEEMQRYIDSLNNNWHITGSYKDQGCARYTGALDLTDAQPVEFTLKARYGAALSDGTIAFSPEGMAAVQ